MSSDEIAASEAGPAWSKVASLEKKKKENRNPKEKNAQGALHRTTSKIKKILFHGQSPLLTLSTGATI